MNITRTFVGAMGLLSCPAFTQTSATPKFEVASIRPHTSDDRRMGFHPSPGRWEATGVTLTLLIQNAYRTQTYLIFGGPGWAHSDRYDIVAKTEDNVDRDQLRRMIQTLLEDRFKLKVRQETREIPVYALVVAKNGPKLPKAEGECVAPAVLNARPPFLPERGKVPSLPCDGISVRPDHIYGLNLSVNVLARDALSQVLQRPVLDQTGLTGRYFVELEWTPDQPRPQSDVRNPPGQPPSEPSGPDIFTAIQEQLGLKLESRKAPAEVLVIDHVERPDEN